jgi:type II secretory pathway pseudopilin PulG
MSAQDRQVGMTLIELLSVIAIIMVIVALAVPNFSTMLRSQRWASAATALQNAIQRCQTFAVNGHQDHAIEFCTCPDNSAQYFRIEVESALLESIPELNAYYRNQADMLEVRLPRDWKQAFVAAGGTTENDSTDYIVNPNLVFNYTGPRYDVNGTGYQLPFRIKDNLKVDEEIYLPHSIKVDFAASTHLINYDKPPQTTLDMPYYGWDYTKDLRFNMTGTLVQAQNPEIVLVNTIGEHMRLQVLRSTGRVRKLSGLD